MTQPYRALIVEDEPAIRELVMRGLRAEGVHCEEAADGLCGAQAARRGQFDVVITDLRMPHRNGHSLAVELLATPNRPLVVVLTGVPEPRLAQDLLVRGVDDVMFKPVDFRLFASKVKGLIERRRLQPLPSQAASGAAALGAADKDDGPVTLGQLKEKLLDFGRILPISDVAVEIVSLTNSADYDASKAAKVVERDAALVADVFRTVNTPWFNTSGRKITQLDEALVRLGQKRVGEMALASKALDALTSSVLPWMDLGLCWRTSLAAGAAMKMLLPQSGLIDAEGLYLGALMHPVGRIVLGTLFPRRYRRMVVQCQQQQAALQHLERQEFPETHAEIATRLLQRWKLPDEAVQPLRYVCRPYAALGELYEPLRTKVELLKLSILFGRLAAGRLEPWELVEIPPPGMLERWKAEELAQVVSRARAELEEQSPADLLNPPQPDALDATPPKELNYVNHSGARFDFVEPLLASLGYQPAPPQSSEEPALVNCVGAEPPPEPGTGSRSVILAARPEAARYDRLGQVIAVPLSYAALRSACEAVFAPKA